MYSAAARPSSSRAAPAKNRIWSTIGGISSDIVRPKGLPVFSHSARTSSSARVSMVSAMRMRAKLRSEGVVRRHEVNASRAERRAKSTSSAFDTGARAKASPVLGSITAAAVPLFASTKLPPTKLRSSRTSTNITEPPPRDKDPEGPGVMVMATSSAARHIGSEADVSRYRELSLWWAQVPGPLHERPALAGDIDVDVAIVGGGFTGLWTAHSLVSADPSLRVAVVEAEVAGFGASGRNGGWCS